MDVRLSWCRVAHVILLRSGLREPAVIMASVVAVGDSVPADVTLDFGFPPEKINLAERCAGKKIILLGLPGAFTPT